MSKPAVKDTPKSVAFLAGGIAGITELAIMYPLDVIKTRTQLSTAKVQKSMVSSLYNMFKNEGLRSTYRGLMFPTFVEAPKRAVKFASNEMYKPLFRNQFNVTDERLLALFTGIGSGITEAAMVTPAELVKVRLQNIKNKALYSGTGDCFMKILKSNGVFGLYRGFEATAFRHAIWNGAYFCSISNIRHAMPKAETKFQTLAITFISGTIGGTLGTVLNLPFDVAKSRIQDSLASDGKYRWSLQTIPLIAREEGFKALYKGFLPKLARFAPGGAIILIVYDFVVGILT